MSYGVSGALQAAVYQLLASDAGLAALVGASVFDEMPEGLVPGTYVSLGAEEVRDLSDKTGYFADHRFVVSVVTDAEGFAPAKAAAAAVSDALVDRAPVLARGRVVSLRFLKARARRVRRGATRRIDLTFRAIVEDS